MQIKIRLHLKICVSAGKGEKSEVKYYKMRNALAGVGLRMLSLGMLLWHKYKTNMGSIPKKERVNVYIDGFNLYFGMLHAGFTSYKWLNLYQLAISLLKTNQELHEVKYFTSRVSNDPFKQKRQNTYLEALEATGVKIYYGNYQPNKIECKRCGNIWISYNEKMTDVNISTNMIVDAYNNSYDMAMLISGDSDLVPPIKEIHQNFPGKRVFVAFPPKRHNNTVAAVARGYFTIGRKKIADCQFPLEVVKKDGYILTKPDEWIKLL
jgi:uncharacterized LabA/DUF88 family protein